MPKSRTPTVFEPMPRRSALAAIGGAGELLVSPPAQMPICAQTLSCVLNPSMTEGPYWVDQKLNRSDIRVDPTDGSVRAGLPLTLTVNIVRVSGSSCALLPGAYVDIWHCDAAGLYSDAAANNTVGKKFLRGYQVADDNGVAKFTTIYPGWYSGRAVHMHLRIRTYNGTQTLGNFASQLFFDDSISDQVFTAEPYDSRRTRDTRNSNDNIFSGTANSSRTLLTLTRTATSYAATINVGVNMAAPAIGKPAILTDGIGNAASFQAGVSPGAWVSIFGANLATASKVIVSGDIVNGALPTTLGGVSVKINNKAAFPSYISPTQINVQAPADTASGSVQVTVTTSGGTSDAATANLQSILPGFFAKNGYVAATRVDGTIVTGTATTAAGTTQSAKPGEVLQLFGTGCGPTNPAATPGQAFSGAAS